MKTLLLALLLVTGSAWAGWVQVSESDEVDFYIDPATIRKDGNFRAAWEIQNLKRRDENGEFSRRIRKEYDCKQRRSKILSFSLHSEPMAGGTVLINSKLSSTWEAIPPGTPVETALEIVCAR